MKNVQLHIARQASNFSDAKLFAYLRDTRIEPSVRLTFIPYIAHFVLTFADLRLLLTELPPHDRCQEVVNDHVTEEDGHCDWFLTDLATMGMDPTMRFTDALRFIWGNSTVKTRRLSYELCKLAAASTSLHRLVLMLSVEATAKVAFEAAGAPAREIELSSGKTLVYFGRRHLQAEQGHALKAEDASRFLQEIVLQTSVQKELMLMVDNVFRYFSEFVDESFAMASRGGGFGKVPE